MSIFKITDSYESKYKEDIKNKEDINITEHLIKLIPSSYTVNKDYHDLLYYYLNQNVKNLYGSSILPNENVDLVRTNEGIIITSIYPGLDKVIVRKENVPNYQDGEDVEYITASTNDKKLFRIELSNKLLAKNHIDYPYEDKNITRDYLTDVKDDKYRLRTQVDGNNVADYELRGMGIQKGMEQLYSLKNNLVNKNNNESKSFLKRIYDEVGSSSSSISIPVSSTYDACAYAFDELINRSDELVNQKIHTGIQRKKKANRKYDKSSINR